jgi:hypothetical protein
LDRERPATGDSLFRITYMDVEGGATDTLSLLNAKYSLIKQDFSVEGLGTCIASEERSSSVGEEDRLGIRR